MSQLKKFQKLSSLFAMLSKLSVIFFGLLLPLLISAQQSKGHFLNPEEESVAEKQLRGELNSELRDELREMLMFHGVPVPQMESEDSSFSDPWMTSRASRRDHSSFGKAQMAKKRLRMTGK
ncbi:uncharacterized protein LOC134842689 [Symsagittifera roscoffensis]|uniref:uncharacterized protein LOC134842689 n=1 Tax=Symsagittifera roscoffensis TaxID=84072 RepID=UPI00307C2897